MSHAHTAPNTGALAGDTVAPALTAVPDGVGNPVGK